MTRYDNLDFKTIRAIVKQMCKKGCMPNRDYTHEWSGKDGCASAIIATTEKGRTQLAAAVKAL